MTVTEVALTVLASAQLIGGGTTALAGCPVSKTLTSGYSTFATDEAPSGYVADGYLNSVSCSWTIAPVTESDWDKIKVIFDDCEIDSGDVVSFYDASGQYPSTKALYTVDSNCKSGITEVTLSLKSIRVVWTTDISTSARGFVASYVVVSNGLDTGGLIGGLVAAGVSIAVLGALATCTCIILRYRVREKYNASLLVEASTYDQAEEPVPPHHEVTLVALKELEASGMSLSKTRLAFGLGEKEAAPVNVCLEDSVELMNLNPYPIRYHAYVPNGGQAFICSLRPAKGIIPPKAAFSVVVKWTMLYTTKVDRLIKVCFTKPGCHNKDGSGTGYIQITGEGAISDRLDPADIVIEPIALGQGASGAVYKGMYR